MPKRTNPFQRTIAMVLSLLEDGAVVRESVEFADPVTGKPREVDVVVVRGKVRGLQVQIGVECVDHSASKKNKKADVQWVELQHGKHSRLEATDSVILVSSTGFTATAKAVAEDLGYRTITPNIAKSELADLLTEDIGLSSGGFQLKVMAAYLTTSESEIVNAVEASDEFLRADGSKLVSATDFLNNAAWRKVEEENLWSLGEDRSYHDLALSIDCPTYDGEHLYVEAADGQPEHFASVDRLEITMLFMTTGMAQIHLTEIGDLDGNGFATGVSPTGPTGSRSVAVGTPGGMATETSFENGFPGPDETPPSLCSTVRFAFRRRPR
jgi:hypothetical protein